MEKKNFFESLTPRSALIVGIVSGVLLICTIGFIVTVSMAFHGGLNCSAKTTGTTALNTGGDTTPPEVVKSDKPKVELFVMSYCPYGLQMEKAYLPVMELLKDKADLSIKFVSYAMHEKKEIDENTRQYCISKDQSSKFIAYLKCFTGKDDYKACLQSAGVNESSVNSCMAKADKEFGITEKYDDQSTWLNGRFPVYPIHAGLNEQYGVQGSPTLVINGSEVSAARSPEAVKQAVCAAFNKAPSECGTKLDTASAGAGFGTASAGSATDASCG